MYASKILASDFGVKANSTDGTDGCDDSAALNAAIAFADGREVILPQGGIRLAAPLVRHTTGDKGGLWLSGSGRETTILWCDFNGDAGIDVDGSTADPFEFQFGGGLRDMAIKASPGRTIEAGVSTIGWFKAALNSVYIQGFDYGIYVPVVEGEGLGNPDSYQSTDWLLELVEIRGCGTGIFAANGQGSAIWRLQKCRIEGNSEHGVRFHGSNWSFIDSSVSFNGSEEGVGYGIYVEADIETGSCTNLDVHSCELDGNRTAACYLSYILFFRVVQNRCISRRSEFLGAEDPTDNSLIHFEINPDLPTSGLFQGNYHRIDTFGLDPEQNSFGPVEGAVTYYDGGSGGPNVAGVVIDSYREVASTQITGDLTASSTTVSNLSETDGLQVGQAIRGTGIPAGATITAVNTGAGTLTLSSAATSSGTGVTLTITAERTVASAGLLQSRYRNFIVQTGGQAINADRRQFSFRGEVSGNWPTSLTAVSQSVAATGWQDSYSGGAVTLPFEGEVEVRMSAVLENVTASDLFIFYIYKNGSIVSDYQLNPAGNQLRLPLNWSARIPCAQGDVLTFERGGAAGARTVRTMSIAMKAV